MKKIILAFITLSLLLSAVSCSAPSYSDAKSASELADAVASAITTEGGTKVLDSDAILEISDAEIPHLRDFIMIRANNAKNVNEYGIFRVESGSVNDVKLLVEDYLENKRKSYLAMNYLPEETEKINCATVNVFGNYVVYSFLNESDTEALHKAIKSAISK